MTTLITQTITLLCTPKKAYNMYMNQNLHTKITGAPANITAKVGTKFSAHGGWLLGKNLRLISGKLIVQSWRAKNWTKKTPDSTLILTFEKKGKGCKLTMMHINVPKKHAPKIKKGWNEHYWNKYKAYLKK